MNQSIFSQSFQQPSGSPIRELFPYLSRPGIISFAGGYPSPSLFDAEGIQQATERVMRDCRQMLQYGATEGQAPLREQLAALSVRRGITASAGDVLITTGSQQAFDLVVRVLINPGDVALIESPAYPAAIQALRLAGARLQAVPSDEEGLDPEAIESWMSRRSAAAGQVKLLYLVPNFSNPSGSVLAARRRRRLVELAIRHGFLIVEDDPYGELSFTDERRVSLFQHGVEMAGKNNPVVYLSSLSKTVAPALRTGWMVASAELSRRCAIAKQTADLCTSPLTQMIAAEYLQSGRYSHAVEVATSEYRRRMELLLVELTGQLGMHVHAVRPSGGMFLWAKLGEEVEPEALFKAAVQSNVLYVPGAVFYPGEPDARTMRLSFAGPSLEEIREGVSRFQLAVDLTLH